MSFYEYRGIRVTALFWLPNFGHVVKATQDLLPFSLRTRLFWLGEKNRKIILKNGFRDRSSCPDLCQNMVGFRKKNYLHP